MLNKINPLSAMRLSALCMLFAAIAVLAPGCATTSSDGACETYPPHGGPCCADMDKACSSEQKACSSEGKACSSAEAKCAKPCCKDKPCGDAKCCESKKACCDEKKACSSK